MGGDTTQAYAGAASWSLTNAVGGSNVSGSGTASIPVDPSRAYTFSARVMSPQAGTGIRYCLGYQCYDVDNQLIAAYHTMFLGGRRPPSPRTCVRATPRSVSRASRTG